MSKGYKTYTSSERENALQLLDEIQNYRQVTIKTGISYNTLKRWQKERVGGLLKTDKGKIAMQSLNDMVDQYRIELNELLKKMRDARTQDDMKMYARLIDRFDRAVNTLAKLEIPDLAKNEVLEIHVQYGSPDRETETDI